MSSDDTIIVNIRSKIVQFSLESILFADREDKSSESLS